MKIDAVIENKPYITNILDKESGITAHITVTGAGVYGDTDITYNETGITYNEAGQIYGGRDLVQDIGPQIMSIQTKGHIYGASSVKQDTAPTIIKIYDESETRGGVTITLHAGMPMGLLLALTYDTTTTYNQ